MPDKRHHRGAHPDDERLFRPQDWDTMKAALMDLSMLLSKGYPLNASLKLIGDHFDLTQRQRLAAMRSACSDDQRCLRKSHCWINRVQIRMLLNF